MENTGARCFYNLTVLPDGPFKWLKFIIANGPLKLPCGWEGLRIATGGNHCLVLARADSSQSKKDAGSKKRKKAAADSTMKAAMGSMFRAYAVGSNSHGQLGHGGNDTSSLKYVMALKDSVEAIFAVPKKNVSYVIDAHGCLKGFGDTQLTGKVPVGVDCHDIRIADSFVLVTHKVNEEFRFVKVDSSTGACNPIAFAGGIITKIYGIKTAGDHVCLKVGIKKQNP